MTNIQTIAQDDASAFWWRARVSLTGIISIFHNASEDFAVDDDVWVHYKMDDHKSLIALGRFIASEAIPYLEGLKRAAVLWQHRAKEQGWKSEESMPQSSDTISPDDYEEFALEAQFCITSLSENAAQLYRLLNNPDWQARLIDKTYCADGASEISDEAIYVTGCIDRLREAAEIWKARAVEAGWLEAIGAAFPVMEPGKTQGDLSSERHRLAELMLDESLSLGAMRAARIDLESNTEEMSTGVAR
jgi:hypothetical protein